MVQTAKQLFGILLPLLIALLACLVIIGFVSLQTSKKASPIEGSSAGRVKVKGLSGLSFCPSPKHPDQIAAIGDKKFHVVTGRLTSGNKWQQLASHNVKKLIPNRLPKSQWEALACDGDGNIHILEEHPGAIYVFSPDLKKLLKVVTLEFNATNPPGWQSEPNSRGEGLIILESNHYLLLKEKNPILLVEYGPKGAAPVGFSPKAGGPPLKVDMRFGSTSIAYVPLKT